MEALAYSVVVIFLGFVLYMVVGSIVTIGNSARKVEEEHDKEMLERIARKHKIVSKDIGKPDPDMLKKLLRNAKKFSQDK